MNRRIKSTVLGSELQDFWLLPIFSSNHPNTLNNKFSSVQPLSHVQLLATPWTAAHQAFLSITNSWSLLKLMSIELVMPSKYLMVCRPLLLLPSIFSSIRVFSNESVICIRGPKYWSFSLSINPSNEYSGLISFSIDSFDLLAVQETLKSLLQHHSSKASILRHSAFFIVQLSHPYTTTGKTIAFTRWTFVDKVMSLLFNMLSRLVIAFLPRSKHLFMAAVTICSDFGAQKSKVSHCFHYFPISLPWSDGIRCHDLSVLLLLLLFLFFYWRMIALQNFVVFCQTSTWISHRYTYIPFWTSLPSPAPSYPSRLIQSLCLSFLSPTANSCWLSILHMVICFHVALSIHLTLSSPHPMSISLFSMSISPLLPCK